MLQATRGRPTGRAAAAVAAAAAQVPVVNIAHGAENALVQPFIDNPDLPPLPLLPLVEPAMPPPLTPLEEAFMEIGFSENGARILASPNDENITLLSLATMGDAEVKTLCATMRKPGGNVPGIHVATRAELSLKTACYMARHFKRTSRVMHPEDLTMDNVATYSNHRKAEEAYKEPTEKLKLMKPEKMLEFIDEWPEQLALFNGQFGRPLSYVIRDKVEPNNEYDDPPFGEEDSIYGSLRDEIEARAPHKTHEYRVDNAAVFEMLNSSVAEHKNVKTWIKAFSSKKDGREAWKAFKDHYRGTDQLEEIEAKAEKQLMTLVYRGEKARYNFETHVSKHLQAHLDIIKAGGELRENKKVRYLLNSIDTSTLAAPIATVKATPRLLASFDLTTNYLRTFIIATELTEQRNVSSISGEKRARSGQDGNKTKKHKGNKKGEKKGKTKHPKTGTDRYYKPAEWSALSYDQKGEVIKLRNSRGPQVSATSTGPTVSSVQTTQR